MNTQPRRTAAEIIAFRLGWDISDVRDGRYQVGRTGPVAVYVCSDDYYCAPRPGQKLPNGWEWKSEGEWLGRTVYCASAKASA